MSESRKLQDEYCNVWSLDRLCIYGDYINNLSIHHQGSQIPAEVREFLVV
jgi:hypothetical protein